jgi:hypothetical protein
MSARNDDLRKYLAPSVPPPSPEDIYRARLRARLTQVRAARLICARCWDWQCWESGRYRMHPGLYRFFLHVTGQYDVLMAHAELTLASRPRPGAFHPPPPIARPPKPRPLRAPDEPVGRAGG